MKKTALLILLMAVTCTSGAQTELILTPGLSLSEDSIVRRNLIAGLNGFLQSIRTAGADNPFIAARDQAQTLDLLDEMTGIQKSRKYGDDQFYKPCLLNVAPAPEGSYRIQLAFTGIADGQALPRAAFNLVAIASGDGRFRFSAPLRPNTAGWKVKRLGAVNVHYRRDAELAQAVAYSSCVARYDKKLGRTRTVTEYYCCADAMESLQVLGIMYKTDYSGRTDISLSHAWHDTEVIVAGRAGGSPFRFDPHDLWHSRLRGVVAGDRINKPVDEGCAYLYGGSWGMSWDAIYRKFMDTLGGRPQADWLALYDSTYTFYSDRGRSPLIAGYVISALIVQKIEQEQGFAAVMKLLSCGRQEPGNANYFAVLSGLTGITKASFNEAVGKLIQQEAGRRRVGRR